MKTSKKNSKVGVRVPSLDPVVLNSDLLKGIVNDSQGINGWAYRQIHDFIDKSFPMSHNPLETLRKLLPKWQWSIHEVEVNDSLEGEIGHPAYSNWCGYSGFSGEEQVICQWAYISLEKKVYHIVAMRPVKELGFACKTAGKGEYDPRWVLVDFNTVVGVKNGWNTQSYPAGDKLEPHTFRHFAGLIPDGTRPTPVEKIGESRDWKEGSPWGSGEWGRSGYETDYRMPDGSKLTKSVTTDEWP